MSTLADKKCAPCEGGVAPLSAVRANVPCITTVQGLGASAVAFLFISKFQNSFPTPTRSLTQ